MIVQRRMPTPPVTAIVLCGGTSARMGGADKTALAVGGATVLDRLLDGLPPSWGVVCVGVERPTRREVRWTREDPPLGGPAAGIAAGAALSTSPVTVVLAGDQPFAADAAQTVVEALVRAEADDHAGAGGDVDGAALAEPDGRLQPLLAAYRTAALREAFPPGTRDVGVHRTAAGLRLVPVAPPTERALLDVDTPADLAQARTLTTPKD